jgi:hypothetical protein
MKMLEFLTSLATDTELMSAFRKSPHAALNSAGLSEEDQRALLAGDPVALRQAVYAERAVAARLATGKLESEGKPEDCPQQPDSRPEEIAVHPPPPKPDSRPEEIAVHPPPPRPDSRPEEIAVHPPPPKPDSRPEEIAVHPPPPKQSAASEVESVQVEPLDPELDLAQDAVLAGIGSGRVADQEPCGVWCAKGLTVVGTGMRAGLHMTTETRLAIEQAKRVLYLVADPVSEAIIAKILDELESTGDLCAAFYGHPGVLTYPAWESIRRARAIGRRARMLPAISTEDALFADLGFDIGRAGLQSFEASRFMYYKYNFDPSAGLLLWQVSVLGEVDWNPPHTGVRPRLEVLAGYLMKFYGPEHEVFLYHAPELPTSRPLIERVALRDLSRAESIAMSTLYIPPQGQPERNEENLQALARMEVRQ